MGGFFMSHSYILNEIRKQIVGKLYDKVCQRRREDEKKFSIKYAILALRNDDIKNLYATFLARKLKKTDVLYLKKSHNLSFVEIDGEKQIIVYPDKAKVLTDLKKSMLIEINSSLNFNSKGLQDYIKVQSPFNIPQETYDLVDELFGYKCEINFNDYKSRYM